MEILESAAKTTKMTESLEHLSQEGTLGEMSSLEQKSLR